MTSRSRHVLCAVDYSAASRTALRVAMLAAERADARLTVVTVSDPLLVEAMRAYGPGDWRDAEREELAAFSSEALGARQAFDVDVRVGRAADEILEAAAALPADLLVLGSHGLTGVRKMFFGSTAERVLRRSEIPVLVTPGNLHTVSGPMTPASLVRRILVPVDLLEGTGPLVRIGAALGRTLGVPVLAAHAVEPLHLPVRWQGRVASLQVEVRDRATAALERMVEEVGGGIEPLVLFGDAADTIVNIAEVRSAGLIVMGLQQSGLGRVGVVAYRVLCRAHVPVLAIPPAAAVRLASAVALPAAAPVREPVQ